MLLTAIAVMLCAAQPARCQILTAKVTGGELSGVVKDGIATGMIDQSRGHLGNTTCLIDRHTFDQLGVKEGERVLHRERHYGKVARAFRLGAEIDQAAASAKFVDGVLELTLPKKTEVAGRQLTIQ